MLIGTVLQKYPQKSCVTFAIQNLEKETQSAIESRSEAETRLVEVERKAEEMRKEAEAIESQEWVERIRAEMEQLRRGEEEC